MLNSRRAKNQIRLRFSRIYLMQKLKKRRFRDLMISRLNIV